MNNGAADVKKSTAENKAFLMFLKDFMP